MTGPTESRIPVFDGHNDTLTRMRRVGSGESWSFLERSDRGHIDLHRAREGGLVGGFFAIFTPSPGYELSFEPLLDERGEPIPGGWSVPLPPKLDRRTALTFTVSVISDLLRFERASDGAVAVARSANDVRRCREEGRLAAVLHIEGAEAIDTRLQALDVLYEAGLRSLGLVWSRPNAFAHGVPFDFPRSPDTGPGITPHGRRLVDACNRMGVLVDLSHLNERGFWDVARLSEAPLVVSHASAHALCPSPRNLTDRQLDAVAASGGIVGINFHKGFIRQDGLADEVTSLTEIVRHVRYVADRIGVEHVGLGSDFDGAAMPEDLGDVAGLPRLLDALAQAGFGGEDLRRIAHGNWERVLAATL
jgi:membrane dipeptidase